MNTQDLLNQRNPEEEVDEVVLEDPPEGVVEAGVGADGPLGKGRRACLPAAVVVAPAQRVHPLHLVPHLVAEGETGRREGLVWERRVSGVGRGETG